MSSNRPIINDIINPKYAVSTIPNHAHFYCRLSELLILFGGFSTAAQNSVPALKAYCWAIVFSFMQPTFTPFWLLKSVLRQLLRSPKTWTAESWSLKIFFIYIFTIFRLSLSCERLSAKKSSFYRIQLIFRRNLNALTFFIRSILQTTLSFQNTIDARADLGLMNIKLVFTRSLSVGFVPKSKRKAKSASAFMCLKKFRQNLTI